MTLLGILRRMTIIETAYELDALANEIYHANIVTLEQRESIQRLAKLNLLNIERIEDKLKVMVEGL